MEKQMKKEEQFAELLKETIWNFFESFFFFFQTVRFENRFLGTSEIFSAYENMKWKQQKKRRIIL